MEIIRTIESNILADVHRQITNLHNACFRSTLSRSYFKQLSHFRYLVFVVRYQAALHPVFPADIITLFSVF